MSKALASRRRTWFIIHGWFGANLALMTALLFLSGTLATVSHEIDWLFDKSVRAQGLARNISWEQLRTLVSQAAPGERISSIMLGPERVITPEWDLPFAAKVAVVDHTGDERILLVDLDAGKVTGARSYIDFPFLVRQLHYNLFAHPWGFYLNVTLAAWVIGAIVTGLVSYRRFWRGFFRRPRWHAAPRVLWGDLHRLLALWSLLFLILISMTGFWYLVPDLIMRFTSGGAKNIERITPHHMQSLDELAARAEAAIPGFDVRLILLPETPGGPIEFWGQADQPLLHQRGNRVQLNSATGEILSVYRASGKGALYRWNDTVDALHFGSFGGLIGRIVWCFFGIATSLLILSGTFIRAYRLSGEIGWHFGWMESWRWVNFGLLFVPAAGLIILLVQ